ncbi:hypothetical protein FQA39_LY11544 [Lamprigera yunnana]|nr:hypothetical protein FQA39_LY11544 [Lamprigera yunnana]
MVTESEFKSKIRILNKEIESSTYKNTNLVESFQSSLKLQRKYMKAISRSQKIVELARKQYTESNPQSMWMDPQSNFDDQLENLKHDGDGYEVESDSCSKHSDHHIKMLNKQ